MPDVLSTPSLDMGVDLESLYDHEEQNPDNVGHIVRRQGQLGAGALIVAAAEAGMEVTALCGHKWVPKGHAPDDLDACRRCLELWQEITGGGS